MNESMTIAEDGDATLGRMARQNDVSMSTAMQTIAMLIDRRISTARQFPRSVARFKREAEALLCEDIETAKSAEYAKPVGGGYVRGPSVRLAEIALLCWGNVEVEMSEPVVTDKSVSVKASAYDLEKNIRQESVVTTSILNKNGQRYPQHMIETTAMATAAKARRNAIQSVIPRAYINDLLRVAKAVAEKNAPSLEEVRAKLVETFARNFKVTPEQICEALSIQGIEDIRQDELDMLRGIYTSIKDEGANPADFFKAPAESKAEAVRQKLAGRKPKEEAKDKSAENSGALPGMASENTDAIKQ